MEIILGQLDGGDLKVIQSQRIVILCQMIVHEFRVIVLGDHFFRGIDGLNKIECSCIGKQLIINLNIQIFQMKPLLEE